MSLRAAWRALWGADQRKDSLSHPLLAIFGAGRAVPTPREYDKLAKEGFQANAVVFRCVNLISECAAAIPWQLFRGQGDGRREIDQHPLLDLLARPNPMQGGSAFFHSVYAFRLLAGNTYIEAAGPELGVRAGRPQELWVLRPDRMRVIKGERGIPGGYEYTAGGQKVRWDVLPDGRSPILHTKSFHPLDDWYGMSPLEAMAFEVDQHNAAGQWNFSLLKNGARPAGALVYSPRDEGASDILSDDQYASINKQLDEVDGPGGAGRPLILEGGLDWREMSISPKDMDWLKGRDVSARDIAMGYDVPPQLVGIEGSQTFANFEQARLSLYEDAVLPLVDSYADDLNRWLVPAFGPDLELGFDQDAIPALSPRRKEKWDMVRQSDFLTVNEKRQELGFDAVEGGDVVLVPLTVTPLGAEPPEPDPEEDEARGLLAPPEGGTTADDANRRFRLAYAAPEAGKSDSSAA